jgi:hypothetical protein
LGADRIRRYFPTVSDCGRFFGTDNKILISAFNAFLGGDNFLRAIARFETGVFVSVDYVEGQHRYDVVQFILQAVVQAIPNFERWDYLMLVA